MWPLSLKASLTMIGTAVAIIAGLLTIANQAQIAEPWWIASRSFVRDQVAEQQKFIRVQIGPLEQRQIAQEINQLRAAKDNSRDKIFDLDVLEKKDALPMDVVRNIDKQKQELQDRIEGINTRLQQLEAERNKPHN